MLSCGPLVISPPAMKFGDPLDGTFCVANHTPCAAVLIFSCVVKRCGPQSGAVPQLIFLHVGHFVFSSPALKRSRPPNWQGLRSQCAHLWAISDFVSML